MKGRLLCAAALLVGLLLVEGLATAETYELRVWGYCEGTNHCGKGVFRTYERWVRNTVHWMNVIFEPTGISFYPVVEPVVDDGYYSEVNGCNGDEESVDYQRRAEWQTSVAANHPGVISMMVTRGPNLCCSYVPDNISTPSDLYRGLWCDVNRKNPKANGALWAHEMAHHWGLFHPFTLDDAPDVAPYPVNHDGDGFADTPEDPGPFESYREGMDGRDQDAGGNTIVGHEYCTSIPLSGITDDGSPQTHVCQVSCWEQTSSGPTPTTFHPLPNLVVSYYGSPCVGPYVVNGHRTEAFTQESINQIQWVHDNIPARLDLVDVCELEGGDTDGDGFCDNWDNCVFDRNTDQWDFDEDGIGNVCDLCPTNPNPTGDMDNDGIGDICDLNIDGDSCSNAVDQHPYVANVVVGSHSDPTCDPPSWAITAWEGVSSDSDPIWDCADVDDDNDGICDDARAQPETAPGAPPGGCLPGPDPCPLEAGDGCHISTIGQCLPQWAAACSGPGCSNHYVRFLNVSNPDPTSELIFDRVQILNEELFLGAPFGKALSEAGMALQGGPAVMASGGSPYQTGDTLRLELWENGSTEPPLLIAEYPANGATVADVTRGLVLAVKPTMDPTGGQELDVRAVYAPGVGESDTEADEDGDGRPDAWDNCISLANPLQTDADEDGFGNACDGDLDGDGIVDADDIAAIQACYGADLTLEIPYSEPSYWVNGTVLYDPDLDAVFFAEGCRAADLNDDQLVDASDTTIAQQAEGTYPGPSSQTDTVPSHSIFADGFEPGDTSRWSGAVP